MVSRSVWQVNIDHYLVDTQHLTLAAHGAYVLLLMHYWKHGGLPTEEEDVRRITGALPLQWRRLRPTLQKFFRGGWKHKRVENDLANYAKFVAKQRSNSRKRWPVDNSTGQDRVATTRGRGSKPLMKQGVDHPTGYAVGMPPLSKKDNLSYRDELAVEKQPDPASSLASALPSGALARLPTRDQTKAQQAQQAWERDFLDKYGPKAYAKAIDVFAAHPELIDRATRMELRKPRSGVMAAVIGIKRVSEMGQP